MTATQLTQDQIDAGLRRVRLNDGQVVIGKPVYFYNLVTRTLQLAKVNFPACRGAADCWGYRAVAAILPD